MCDVLGGLETSEVSRRNILASFGFAAAAITLQDAPAPPEELGGVSFAVVRSRIS